MKEVVIASAVRTAIGSFGGTLKGVSAVDLGATVIKEAVNRAGIKPEAVEEVVMGNVIQAGLGQNTARQATIKAGLPEEVPAMTINKVCGSGLRTVALAAQMIKAGDADVVVAGGMESMSNAPYALKDMRWGHKMNAVPTVDTMINDALWDAFNNYHMGVTAENIAKQWNITREEQDEFALASQQKAIKAIDDGLFKDEIVPITIKTKKEEFVFDTDEFPNRKTNLEKLAKLRPAFVKDGSVTAGNASGINDGAAFLLVASEESLKENHLTPLVEIIGVGQGGVDPQYMGLGPVPAIRNALKNANLTLKDIDIFELNEAFSAQSLGVIKELTEEHHVDKDWLLERTNVTGGAIALGHPVGCSGARIMVTLIHNMIRNNKKIGLASLCIGGGMGTAVILKLI